LKHDLVAWVQAERSGLSLANQNYLPPADRPYQDLVRYRFQPNHNGGRQLFKRSASPDTPVLLSPEPSPLHASSPESLIDCEQQLKLRHLPAPSGGGAAELSSKSPEGGELMGHPLQESAEADGGKEDSMRIRGGVPPPSNGIAEEPRHQEQLTSLMTTTNRVESHYYTASKSSRSRGNPANVISGGLKTNRPGESTRSNNSSSNNNNNNNEERSSGELEKPYRSADRQPVKNSSNSWDSACGDSSSSSYDHSSLVVKRTKTDSHAHDKTVLTNHRPPSLAADEPETDGESRQRRPGGRTSVPCRDNLHSVPSRETGAIPKQRRRLAASPVPHPDEIISLPLDDPLLASPRSLAANSRQHNTYYNFAH
jgi:hypothetical protein